MAGKAFRRLLEIALDKASARKTERDTQDSLRRATDPGVIQKSMDRVGNVIQRSARVFLQAGAAVAGYALSIAKLTERGGQVINVQRAFARVTGDADAAVGKLRKATGGLIADFDLMVGFNRAFSLGAVKTVDQFGEMASVARDLGRALGVDAAYAMEQLSLGIARHSPKILDNLGITAKAGDDFATIMEKARQRVDELGVSGATTADMLTRLKVQFTNFKDEIGKFLASSDTLRVAFFEAGNILETLVESMQTGNIEDAKQAFKHVGTILGTTFAGAFFDAMAATIKAFTEPLGPLGDALLGAFIGFAAGGVPGGIAGGVAGLSASQLPVLLGKAADAARSAADAEVEALAALKGQVEAAIALRKVREGTVTTQARAEAGGGIAVGPTGAFGPLATNANAGLGFGIMGGINAPSPDSLTPVVDHLNEFQHFFLDNMDAIQNAAQVAALGMEAAFEDAFDALIMEGEGLGSALEAVFRGTGAAALAGIVQIATAKVQENIARAIEETALAFGALASFNPASAGSHFKVAGEHTAAAAAWGALGGGLSSLSHAAAGSGGGFRGNDVIGREVDKLDHPAPVVNIYVDGIDPDNPAHVALMQRTVVNAREQWGDQKPTVRRYSRTTA